MIDKNGLFSLVPHRGRMFLLGRVNCYDLEEDSLEAEYDITEECLFFDPIAGGIPAWAGIELAAQTISALFGLKRRAIGKEPRLGFLLSVSMMKTEIPVFRAGSTLMLKSKKINCIDLMYTFECFIFLEGINVFRAKLTAVDVDDESVFKGNGIK